MMTEAELNDLFDAFNRHDIDAIVPYFHDDIVFATVSGPEAYGTRIVGKKAVMAQFEATWGAMPDVQWLNGKHYFAQDRIVSESTFIATQADGRRHHADSVDLFTLRDGKIVRKQAFRKNRPLLDPV
jgi:taurine dehydrogenase small subunit